MGPLERNVEAVRERIAAATERSGRPPGAVRLVAVAKTASVEVTAALVRSGVRELGENRVDALVRKQEAIGDANVCWHMIGHLQRNKVRAFLSTEALLHSLDSERLAAALSHELEREDRPPGDGPLRLLVEVNVAGEAQKGGVAPAELGALLEKVRALPRLEVAGLMTMAPLDPRAEAARPHFRALRELRDRHREHHPELLELSMGMTQDFEVAIEEGATLVRVGTALFRGIEEG